jgi:hypothetical protein
VVAAPIDELGRRALSTRELGHGMDGIDEKLTEQDRICTAWVYHGPDTSLVESILNTALVVVG